MDSRQPHPFPRPPVPNPNHQSPPLPPHTQYGSYPPTTTQPQLPVHVPFSADPYPTSRRDPFMPSAPQHVRRSSYGVPGAEVVAQGERQGGWGHIARPHHASHLHSQSGPPPPSSMSSSQAPANPSQYGYESSRRGSLGAASPPNPYGAPSHEPPPPPPSFARPHMPPPSSPQQPQHHNNATQGQRASYPPTFAGSRELPGLGQAHRPGSSMSISSLIGVSDTGAPGPTSQSQSSPPTNAPSSSSHSMQPPSPRRGQPPVARPDFQSYRRQPSPDRHLYGNNTSRATEAYAYAAGSPPRPYSNQGSPELGRPPLSQTSQPYKPMLFQSQRPYAPSPNDAQMRDSRQTSANIPPRPSSQPSGPPGQPRPETKNVYDASGRRTVYGPAEERRRTLGESHHSRPNTTELLNGTAQPASDRDRPSTVQPLSQSTFSPPRAQRGAMGTNNHVRNPWRQSVPDDTSRESTESRKEEPPASYRGYGGYSAPPQGPAPFGGHRAEDMVRGRSLDHLSHRAVEQYQAPPTSDPHSGDRHRSEQLSRSLSSGGASYPGRSLYDQPRRMGEEMQHSRPFLGFGPDANRRTGRASPLPQAVQGAQAQPLSVGKDPHVKSEFGRMFSGLGSGLGTSTPSRGSPMPQGAQDSLPSGVDLNDHVRLQRVNSQNGRKPKRVKDEEAMFDHESIDGQGTPSGLRGVKRNKHAHPSHHHHHHAHTHHHHHHHHKPEEEMPPSVTSTPFGGKPGTLNGVMQASHHHHHYHGAPHHHHHAPRPTQAPLPSPQIPPKVHDIQAVLDEAAMYPRKHLGSHLYEAITELPKPNSAVDEQFGYASKPNRLPRFPLNPLNCTFTIRVPRYHLRPRQRQQVVLQAHLWGARVYRDDSDPIAAAIHSGWIRGEWDDSVDVNMLDPRITAPNNPSDAEATLTKPPAAPVTPPADMDLQIEILILPQLQEYAGTVEYGISSKRSKFHDGLSFMIHKIRWVDEGIGSRGQERTAAALKQRLDASATLLSLKSGREDQYRAVNGAAKLHA